MTDAAALASPDAPKKRGPNTPEGKARSAMNALKHGLRARAFGILPEEDKAEWAEHVRDLRAGYGPVDAAEEKLVTAIAVAMWNEIRADRTLVETMAEIPPCRPGRSHGTNLQEPRHALLAEHRAALHDRRRHGDAARPARLPRPPQGQVPRPARAGAARARRTARQSELHERKHARTRPPVGPARPGRARFAKMHERIAGPTPAPARTRPAGALRARLDRLLAGPGPKDPEEWDLIAAIRALKLPGAAPYRGGIDPGQLDRLLAEHRFDDAGLAWLAGLRPAHAGPERVALAARG